MAKEISIRRQLDKIVFQLQPNRGSDKSKIITHLTRLSKLAVHGTALFAEIELWLGTAWWMNTIEPSDEIRRNRARHHLETAANHIRHDYNAPPALVVKIYHNFAVLLGETAETIGDLEKAIKTFKLTISPKRPAILGGPQLPWMPRQGAEAAITNRNIGNCHFHIAKLLKKKTDRDAREARIELAITFYEKALQLTPITDLADRSRILYSEADAWIAHMDTTDITPEVSYHNALDRCDTAIALIEAKPSGLEVELADVHYNRGFAHQAAEKRAPLTKEKKRLLQLALEDYKHARTLYMQHHPAGIDETNTRIAEVEAALRHLSIDGEPDEPEAQISGDRFSYPRYSELARWGGRERVAGQSTEASKDALRLAAWNQIETILAEHQASYADARKKLASRLTPILNDYISNSDQKTLDSQRALCEHIREMCQTNLLAVRCPKTGLPTLPFAKPRLDRNIPNRIAYLAGRSETFSEQFIGDLKLMPAEIEALHAHPRINPKGTPRSR